MNKEISNDPQPIEDPVVPAETIQEPHYEEFIEEKPTKPQEPAVSTPEEEEGSISLSKSLYLQVLLFYVDYV